MKNTSLRIQAKEKAELFVNEYKTDSLNLDYSFESLNHIESIIENQTEQLSNTLNVEKLASYTLLTLLENYPKSSIINDNGKTLLTFDGNSNNTLDTTSFIHSRILSKQDNSKKYFF